MAGKTNLSLKQKKFADYWLESGNATESAIKAGYAGKYVGANADKLLKNTKIKEYIESRLKEMEDKKIADITEVMQYLTKGIRQELTEEVVTMEGNIITKKISLRDSNKCAEMLAKRFGILTDKLEVDADMELNINVKRV